MVARGRIAHFNAARLVQPPGDPRVAEFVDNTFKVNAVAERSKGYIWRLADETSLVTGADYSGREGDPRVVYSMSVWETLGDFERFVYKTVHAAFFRRRADWFAPWDGPNYVIWDFEGEPPIATEEGWRRLGLLAANGASADAYDLGFAKAGLTAP